MSQKLKRIAVIFFAAIILLAGTGALLGWLYEDEVKNLVLNEVNQNLQTDIKVEKISLSLFKKFPYAALRFEKLMALDAIETNAPKDTLLYAQDFYLEFSVFDIFTRNYVIRKIDVENAVLRLKVDENGQDNFHFWKQRPESSESHLSFQLQHVGLKNVDFSYRNVQSRFHIDTEIDDLLLSGNFQDARFDLDVKSQLLIQKLQHRDDEYIKNRRTRLAFKIHIDTGAQLYKVKDGAVDFEELGFLVNGSYRMGKDNQALNLDFTGKDIQISDLLVFLPEKYRGKMDGYEPKGKATVDLSLKGDPTSETEPVEVVLEFDIADARFRHKKSGIDLKNMRIKGVYNSRGNHPDLLEIEHFSFVLKEGSIQGSGSITNFQRPLIRFDLTGKAELADLQEFLELHSLEYITGQIELECHFKGLISDPSNLTVADLRKSETRGRLAFKNTAFKIRGKDQKYHHFNGEIHLNGNDAAFKGLEGMILSSDFKMDGLFKNFVPFLLIEKQHLRIDASLQSKYIDLAELLISSQETQNDSAFNFFLPEFIEINVNSKIEQLVFRTFSATNISGFVKINRDGIFAQPLKFRTSDGDFSARMQITESGKKGIFKIDSQAECLGVNINKLFFEFDNFGQSFITQKHLRGTANATVVFKANINQELKIDEKSIYSLIDIKILQGELIGLQSLMEVADYIKKNKLLAPLIKADDFKQRLAHIRFSSLENQIEIKNSKIHIPEMLLQSTALNINAQGWHGFNNEVDYRIHFRLAELLINNKHSEFGEIRDDGSGGSFFLRMKGNIDNLDISYDKETAKQKRKDYFKQEKETFKSLIKEEFNIFGKKEKNNGSTTSPNQSGGGTSFELDFSEDDKEEVPIPKSKSTDTPVAPKPVNPPKNDPKDTKGKKDILKELEEDDDF
jgi:hypothetical protein